MVLKRGVVAVPPSGAAPDVHSSRPLRPSDRAVQEIANFRSSSYRRRVSDVQDQAHTDHSSFDAKILKSVEEFTQNPARRWTPSELEFAPWWIRVVDDAPFRQAIQASITSALRRHDEEAKRDPRIVVVHRGAWNTKNPINRVAGDGITYRWLVPFPPTGFVYLPKNTTKQLAATGKLGVNVFASESPEQFGAQRSYAVNPAKAKVDTNWFDAGRGTTFPRPRGGRTLLVAARSMDTATRLVTDFTDGDGFLADDRHYADELSVLHATGSGPVNEQLHRGPSPRLAVPRSFNGEDAVRPSAAEIGIEFLGTLRMSFRLLRFRMLTASIFDQCRDAIRAPFPKALVKGFPAHTDDLAFDSYERCDLTESRLEFLFSSDTARNSVKNIFGKLPKDINGRITKEGFVQFILDLNNLFMPSFYNEANIALAEDEWICRGSRDRPDFYQFFWFIFDYPTMFMRTEFVSEDLYAAFWDFVFQRLFVDNFRSTDGYADHVSRTQLLVSDDLQMIEPERRVLYIQKKLELFRTKQRQREKRIAIKREFEKAWKDSFEKSACPTDANLVDGLSSEQRARLQVGNVFLDRRRENGNLAELWQAGSTSNTAAMSASFSASRFTAAPVALSPVAAAQLRLTQVEDELASVTQQLQVFSASSDDENDDDHLLSFCSDISDTEFESAQFRVRERYETVKRAAQENDKANLKKRMKALQQAKKRHQEELEEALHAAATASFEAPQALSPERSMMMSNTSMMSPPRGDPISENLEASQQQGLSVSKKHQIRERELLKLDAIQPRRPRQYSMFEAPAGSCYVPAQEQKLPSRRRHPRDATPRVISRPHSKALSSVIVVEPIDSLQPRTPPRESHDSGSLCRTPSVASNANVPEPTGVPPVALETFGIVDTVGFIEDESSDHLRVVEQQRHSEEPGHHSVVPGVSLLSNHMPAHFIVPPAPCKKLITKAYEQRKPVRSAPMAPQTARDHRPRSRPVEQRPTAPHPTSAFAPSIHSPARPNAAATFSRSLLNPSRLLQALHPFHPRTVLMGTTVGTPRSYEE